MIVTKHNDCWEYEAYGPADNVRMIAATANISVKTLAEVMGVQPSTLYNIINGKTTLIHNDTADILARAFLYYTNGDFSRFRAVADAIRYGQEPVYYDAYTLSMWMRYTMVNRNLKATDFIVSNKTIYNIIDSSHKPSRWTIYTICETTGDNPGEVYSTFVKSWRR